MQDEPIETRLTILLHNYKQATLHHVSYGSVIGCSPFPAPAVTSYCVSLKAELLFTSPAAFSFCLLCVCACVCVLVCPCHHLYCCSQNRASSERSLGGSGQIKAEAKSLLVPPSAPKQPLVTFGPQPPSERRRRPGGPLSKWSEIFSSRRWNSDVIPAIKSRLCAPPGR